MTRKEAEAIRDSLTQGKAAIAENSVLEAARDALQARLDRIREATTIEGTVTLSKLKKMLEAIKEAFND